MARGGRRWWATVVLRRWFTGAHRVGENVGGKREVAARGRKRGGLVARVSRAEDKGEEEQVETRWVAMEDHRVTLLACSGEDDNQGDSVSFPNRYGPDVKRRKWAAGRNWIQREERESGPPGWKDEREKRTREMEGAQEGVRGLGFLFLF
jgi:hypothetical protein